jgi:hypothetical protein
MVNLMPDDLLQPLIIALARTPLGFPKAQTAVYANVALLRKVLDSGITYRDIATALETSGVRGRSGRVISRKSLRAMMIRAEKTRNKDAVAPSPSVHGFWSQSRAVLRIPPEAAVTIPSLSNKLPGNDSSGDATLSKIKETLAEAKARKSTAEMLK